MMTTQKQVRDAFWAAVDRGDYKGLDVTRRKITNYSGEGKMHNTDTRVAFVDFVDRSCRDGEISSELASRVTL